jgi:hypothetical protein
MALGGEIRGLKFKYVPRALTDAFTGNSPSLILTITELEEAGYIKPLPLRIWDICAIDFDELFVVADKVLLERFGNANPCKTVAIVGCLRESLSASSDRDSVVLPVWCQTFHARSDLGFISDDVEAWLNNDDYRWEAHFDSLRNGGVPSELTWF